MKIFVPSKSQRNHSLGLFKAQSLGSIQEAKPIDMEAAKAAVRHNRKVHTHEYWEAKEKADRERKKANATKDWWHRRRSWKSVRVGNRIGKLYPRYEWRGWVEFPDGTQQWVELEQDEPAP